jgi:HAD superfamily hydrolase (TIGR01509 family)
MTERAIRNVVFDIGWVLVRLRYAPVIEFLKSRGAAVSDLDSVLARITLAEHESGRMSGRGLLEQLVSLARAPVTIEEMHAQWVDMFDLEREMIELAHRVSDRYRVYLLSNIGDLHWGHLSREYRLHRLGHGALPSYLAGVMKPHAGIYAEAERRFALDPQQTVFVDDRADNIAAARARGWHGIVHGGYPDTAGALRALGVGC